MTDNSPHANRSSDAKKRPLAASANEEGSRGEGDLPAEALPSLTKSIFRLAAGRGTALALGLVAAPILTRLYDRESFGVVGLVMQVILILGSCTSFCYVMAMPLTKSATELRALVVLSFLLSLVSTTILTLACIFGGPEIARLAAALDKPALVTLAKYTWSIPILFFLMAMLMQINMVLGCQKKFGKVAVRNTVNTSGSQLCQIGAAMIGLAQTSGGLLLAAIGGTTAGMAALVLHVGCFTATTDALLIGLIAGATISVLLYARTTIGQVMRTPETPLRLAELKAVAVCYQRFPKIQFWSQSFNSLTQGLPVLVITALFPLETVGIYYWARRLVALPMQLFTASGSQVFYVEAAQAIAKGEDEAVAKSTRELLRLLTGLTSFPLAVVFVLGPLLFRLYLGKDFAEAGVYAAILVPWIAVIAIGSPLASMFMAKEKLGEGFAYNLVLFVVRFGGLLVGGLVFGNVRIALGMFVFGSVVVWCHLVARALYLAGVSRRWAAWHYVVAYAKSFALLVPAGIAYWWFDATVATLALLALACIAYAFLLHLQYPHIRPLLQRILRRKK